MSKVINAIPYIPLSGLLFVYAYALFEGLLKAVEIAFLGNPIPLFVMFTIVGIAFVVRSVLSEDDYGQQE